MRASHGYIVLPVHSVFGAHLLEPFQDTISDGSVSRLGVEDEVHEAFAGFVRVADDEGAGVEALAESRSDLRRVGIAHHVELDDGTVELLVCSGMMYLRHLPSDIRLANADKVRRGILSLAAILLLAVEDILLRSIVCLIKARMPEVDDGESEVDDELSNDQRGNEGSTQCHCDV